MLVLGVPKGGAVNSQAMKRRDSWTLPPHYWMPSAVWPLMILPGFEGELPFNCHKDGFGLIKGSQESNQMLEIRKKNYRN